MTITFLLITCGLVKMGCEPQNVQRPYFLGTPFYITNINNNGATFFTDVE